MSLAPISVLWRGLDPARPSLEHLHLTPWTRAEGVVVGLEDGQPFTLAYGLEAQPDGHPSCLRLSLRAGRALTLHRDGAGHWTDGAGRPWSELEGCTDVDLQATPLTNTLPIRRLGLEVGGSAVLRAAWIGVPSLDVRAVRQRYTRLAAELYRYENLESGFRAEVQVDGEGLVTLYPEAFERLF
ncbi:hypothetical protein DEIPH_ctg084orf0010 [Deinococcus phoenicis]|uniref:Uncharacterized protein n=1 Tax=Deinococcus phoenicis TaxID=1476583 RepID=A0A016QL65_9DEIO|nr:putative glycolipid-binding domain-containing protein [Deinococcus phoenicis]EYB66597.1 hypothetical protein DEIPH_ctg084orf0010 [Deinococcus phoenicis]